MIRTTPDELPPSGRRRALWACGWLAWAAAQAPARAGMRLAQARPSSTAATVDALRQGGHVMVMRHAATEFGEVDAYPYEFDNPSAQRALSDVGRLEARAVGRALKTAGVRTGHVYSGPFRRSTETAEYLGFERFEIWPDLAEDAYANAREQARRAAKLYRLVATAPPAGLNTLIVTHKPVMVRAFGERLASIEPTEMAVFRPLAAGRVSLVGRLTKEDWRAVLQAAPAA
ncbi:histidine phosphatase family protein [Piscinibacter terrae]|uniref:Histidine phosphatase family protein n=1 Tax=Piscinibacter terrae TaxID=2496871 RepID=A0A3N7HKY4_9BURK|nr:histidine phosphatase family protein [Albitalea terrae]RQP22757.1 hypothetical protein DZC73_20890 [Albitalea terrae]